MLPDIAAFDVLVAVIVTDPGATPLTRPALFTVATSASLVVHVTPVGAPVGEMDALSCSVPAIATLFAGPVTLTPVTCGVCCGPVLPPESQAAIPRMAMTRSPAGCGLVRGADIWTSAMARERVRLHPCSSGEWPCFPPSAVRPVMAGPAKRR
jgi:hypothetical protein